jgi:spore maturation protein SpmB
MQVANLLLSLMIELSVFFAARKLWGRRGGIAAMAAAMALLLTPWAGSVSVVLPVALLAMGGALGITAQEAKRETPACLVGAGLLLGLAVGASVDVTMSAVAIVFGAWGRWARAGSSAGRPTSPACAAGWTTTWAM